MTTPTTELARVRRAHLSATIVPAVVGAMALLIVILLSVGDLPERLATRFDLGGTVNDDMSTTVALGLFVLTTVGLPAVLIGVFAATQWWRGEWARGFAGFLAGFAVWLSALFSVLVLANRGATSPEDVRLSPWLMLVGLALGLVVGLVVAAVVPRGVPWPTPDAVTPVALSPSERASWFGRAQLGRLPLLALVASVVLLAVAALTSGILWLWLVAALVGLLVAAVGAFVVTVDASGVRWRSALGLPRGHLPLEEITSAAVVEVSPSDFGGIGLRLTPRGLGIVTRSGPGLEVRRGGKRFVATVDDASTGASLLLGYLEASRHRTG